MDYRLAIGWFLVFITFLPLRQTNELQRDTGTTTNLPDVLYSCRRKRTISHVQKFIMVTRCAKPIGNGDVQSL